MELVGKPGFRRQRTSELKEASLKVGSEIQIKLDSLLGGQSVLSAMVVVIC